MALYEVILVGKSSHNDHNGPMFQVSEEVFRVKCSSFGGTNDLQEG